MDFEDDESTYMEVNYSFLLPQADDRLKIFQKANEMYSSLDEIYHLANAMAKTKAGENPDLAEFAERIAWYATEGMEL